MPTLRIEYAKSGRSKCSLTSCGKVIVKHELRIGTQIILPYSDEGAESWKWRHICCFTDRQLSNAKTSGDLDKIQGYEDLAPSDKALIEKMKRGELVGTSDVVGRVGDVANSPLAAELMGKGAKAAPKKAAKRGAEAPDTANDAAAPKPPAKRAARKPKAPKVTVNDDAASDVTDDYEVDVQAQKGKPVCPYGENCFRTNQEHFDQFSHGEANEAAQGGGESSVLKPVIVRKRSRQE